MTRTALLISMTLLLALGAVVWFARPSPPSPNSNGASELIVHCAANLKQPVEKIAEQFQQETGIAVRLQFGGSGTLLSSIRLVKKGDLFISADTTGIVDAQKFGQIRETFPLARQRPVVAVRKGNPLNIRSYADLSRGDVRVAYSNPETAAIGRTVKKALGDRYAALAAKVAVMKPTVTEIASDVQLGAADAAIVWDSTVPQFKGLEAVELPEFAGISENAVAAVLVHTKQSEAANRFGRYLAAPDKGGVIFREMGFKLPIDGAPAATRPATGEAK